MTQTFYKTYFDQIHSHLSAIEPSVLDQFVAYLADVKAKNSKIILAGNGGSASMASHVAVDLTKAAGVRAITFNEPNLITCFANDYGYERWVEKALESYASKDDLVILISSSGQSQNILNGAKAAKRMGAKLVTLSGFKADNPLRGLGDLNLWINSQQYNYVEMVHHIWLLAVVDRYLDQNE